MAELRTRRMWLKWEIQRSQEGTLWRPCLKHKIAINLLFPTLSCTVFVLVVLKILELIKICYISSHVSIVKMLIILGKSGK